jgi:hypothetical protein
MPDAARAPAATARAPAPARPPTPAPVPARSPTPSGQTARLPAAPTVQLTPGTPNSAVIQAGGGEPLAPDLRRLLERSFSTDLRSVRLHTDTRAQDTARNMSARAFTLGSDIFLGPGERPTDLRLLAHEVAHVVQQRSAPAVQRWSFDSHDHYEREAQQAAAVVVQQQPFAVRERTTPHPQRLGISDALDYFADKANLIPGFRMFTIVLGVNPVNMSRVERSAANIMRALIEFIPGGYLVTQALDNHGIFDKVGNWVEEQISSLGMTGSLIKQALSEFIDSLSWSDIFDLGGVWNRAKRIFTEPIDRIINFAKGLITGIITFIKDAILMPLAKLAEGTRGWDLLIAILGKNPITGEAVPRTAETLIGGFMKLIGQEEIWENMKKANAIARAWAWFQGAMNALLGFVQQIPTLAVNAFKSLELVDIILVPRAFMKVAAVFGNFIGSFITWAGTAVWNLLEIIFEVVAPSVMPYLRKAAAAFKTILKDPIAFVGNLVRAGKLGFQMFASNFFEHLKAALIKWLTGPLGSAGVYIPKSFSLIEIVKLVLSVLGLTWQNIRSKLVKIIPEPVLVGLEKTAGILVTLVKDGPAAAWEQIKAELSELKDQMIAQVTQMITTEVVKAAVVKLVSMLNPAGAFVQAIIAVYNTVTFFIQKINQIAAVVASFIDSISAIAAGQVDNAAKKVEQTMANTLTVIIAFLAKFAGLGNIPEKLVGVIKKIRQPIDRGLDKIVAWLGSMLKKIAATVLQAGVPQDPRTRLRLGMQASIVAIRNLSGTLTQALINPVLSVIKARYGFVQLEAYIRNGTWWVRGRVNPPDEADTGKPEKEKTAEEAHNEVIAKMSSDNKLLLKGHGNFTAGHAGRAFTTATRDAVDDIGYATGDHSFPAITDPGTKGDPATKWGKLGKGNWVPDHQPPDTLAGGGATLSFRFYPHSNSSRLKQGGAVRVYKMWMKEARKRGDSNWAEGVKSDWFW